MLRVSGFFVWGLLAAGAAAQAQESPSKDYRDLRPTIDAIDPIRVLSQDKAAELERSVEQLSARLAPSVVRIWRHAPAPPGGKLGDPPRLAGSLSGVIIDKTGLVLTCAHAETAPRSPLTIELSDGRREAGVALGRFEVSPSNGQIVHPDLALVRIEDAGTWPAAPLSEAGGGTPGAVCLAIGYPGSLPARAAPLLRLGRIAPSAPEWTWISSTTGYCPGDSGGPLFDLDGRVLGVVHGGDEAAGALYQPVAPLAKFKPRLIAGEIVADPRRGTRAQLSRPSHPTAFAPGLDLQDRALAANAQVDVFDGVRQVALGVIVHADGWVLTKRTLVDGCHELRCTVPVTFTGRVFVPARLAASSVEHDLALLKLEGPEGQGLPAAAWASEAPRVGQFVASLLGSGRAPLEYSVVGAAVTEAPPRDVAQVFVDVREGPGGVCEIHGVFADLVTPEVDSFRGHFRPGDVLTKLADTPTPTFADYREALLRLLYVPKPDGTYDFERSAAGNFAGEPVWLTVSRDGRELPLRVLRAHPEMSSPRSWSVCPLSLRRDGFPQVFAHDGGVRPEHCGGPLVDLEGRCLGVNIARADRTRTLAIPAKVVEQVAGELRQQALRSAK